MIRTFSPGRIALVLSLPLVLAAAGAGGQDITIGVIAPLSGAVPQFGTAVKNGVALAISDWNARGGVRGRQVTALYEDGQCSPDPAVNAANRLIYDRKVRYIIGEVCSKASIPVSAMTNAAHVIQISPTSTNLAVTTDENGTTKPYTFRNCFVDPFQGLVAARFAYNRLSARTAYVLFDPSNDYVNGLAETFRREFARLGGTIAGVRTYNGETDTDFSRILVGVSSMKPDIVYLPDYYNVVNLVVKQARSKGITAPFLGGDGWDSDDLDTRVTDGCYYTNHFAPDDPRPEVVSFRSRFEAAYPGQHLDAIAALAYDCADMLLQAMDSSGPDDVESVRTGLENIQYHGLSGTLTFDEHHNPIKTAVVIGIQGGLRKFFSLVEP